MQRKDVTTLSISRRAAIADYSVNHLHTGGIPAKYARMQGLVWLRRVLGEFGQPEDELTSFSIDSQSVEDLALNLVFTRSSNI